MRKAGGILREAWHLASPYYRISNERWSARIVLAAIIALGLLNVGVSVILNFWYGSFYDALQSYDLSGFINLLLWYRWDDHGFMIGFVPLVTFAVPVSILRSYLEQFLMIRWRRWMTNELLAKWLANRAYYTISLTRTPGDAGTDNPDQRVAEDISDFTQNTLTLGVSFINRVTSVFNFSIILWSLSGAITLLGIRIPGYMLFGAIIYAIVGTWLTHLVGRPLIPLNFLKQKAEADFRFALVRFRENTEGVALSGGEQEENAVLTGRFAEVARNWFRIMNRNVKLNGLTLSYAQAAVIFPFILGAPGYFSKQIALGGLMRVISAFGNVQDSLSWFINVYPELASWRATVNRLTSFQASLAAARELDGQGPQIATSGDVLSLRDAQIKLPDGTPVIDHPDFAIRRGESVAISGRSGTGKSTLFRAIAGIWPFGTGRIERAPGTYLFLPQRPYIPLGTLRHAVTYPAAAETFSDEQVQQALIAAGLPDLTSRLGEEALWGQLLSGGEQQRLAIARALLLRPDWLFLDEATSSLDPEAEASLYETVRRTLPGTTVLSIAHRPEVAQFHDEAVVFDRQPGAPGTLHPLQPATMASTALP